MYHLTKKKNFKISLSFAGLLINTTIWGSTFFIVKDMLKNYRKTMPVDKEVLQKM
jgi:hypothetical protein